MVERSKACIYQSSVLGGGGSAQAFKQLRDARFGNIVLLDTGLDDCDILDLCIERGIAAQYGVEVGDLLVGKFCVGHGLLITNLEIEVALVASKLERDLMISEGPR